MSRGYIPSYYNSIRFQKAKRINELETYKLDEKIRVIDKNRKTILDLFKNDIRLLQEDIVNIQLSSGVSEEGRPPTRNDKVLRSGQIVCYVLPTNHKRKKLKRPATSAGERQVSGSRAIQRPQSCPPRSQSELTIEKSSNGQNGRQLQSYREKLRATDVDLPAVDTSERAFRPLTAPNTRKGDNKTRVTDDRPHTARHHTAGTSNKANLELNSPNLENEESVDSDFESRNDSARDDVSVRTLQEHHHHHHHHHVVFASEAKVDFISDDISADDVASDSYESIRGRPPQTRNTSMFMKIGDVEDDEDAKCQSVGNMPRVFVPPATYFKSDASRKSALKKYPDPRTLLLRQGSRNELFSQVGEEDLTKALARHMSRRNQQDPTTPTHASRQKAIGGYSNRKGKRTSLVQASKTGSVSHIEETRRRKLSLTHLS